MKIDIFPHILPIKYKNALHRIYPESYHKRLHEAIPTLFDLKQRFRIMEKFEDLVQVLILSAPPVEVIAGPEKAMYLAQLANDGMAELLVKYPSRFVAAVACLPMNNIDNALKEADRTINDLKFRGVEIYTPINGKPLDSSEFIPLYEKMTKYDLPIWIHPYRSPMSPDYVNESKSMHDIWMIFGWPYETAAAMTRLVMSGIFERYPNIKFITHHCGSLLPFFAQRLVDTYDEDEILLKENPKEGLSRPPIEYFKRFYNDTAIYGNTPALMCAYAFFGPNHLLFGTDMPYDSESGEKSNREIIRAIEQMNISGTEKKQIFEDNARRLLKLSK